MRRRSKWTKRSEAYLRDVVDVLDELRPYWPLTLRQVYYQLVAGLVIENKHSEYKKLGEILVRARLDRLVPMDAIEDRGREAMLFGGWADHKHFIESETEGFLQGYRRDLQQGQAVALEVWLEKQALQNVFEPVCDEYCVPLVVCKGYGSISLLNDAAERFRRRLRTTCILYFGDLDPSGWNMLPATMETFEEMDVGHKVISERCALLPEQVKLYKMPVSPDALKSGDSRARAYMEMFGNLAVELDAFKPSDLQDLVRESIENNMEMRTYNNQLKAEKRDLKALKKKRDEVLDVL